MPAPLAGKYELLRKLAMGGMAEVFLARQVGLEGFEKLVVVKRILPHLAQSEEFVRMFLDEARTAADLRHPNVVTVFEVGEDAGAWFLVMEFLHGQNLRRVERAAVEAGTPMPLAHALRIVLDAANGLHYAHRKTDLRGKPLGIVHRDVSPQNIIVTYDGVAKIVDFGIARAAGTTHDTRSGVVRGKLSFMSPEQVHGETVDHRSDQFSLGVVLYELTTGQRLFQRASDVQTMHAVAECAVPPPSTIVADYPPGLEAIVMRTLAKNPAQRFPNCADLVLALEDHLAASGIAHSSTRLSAYLRQLFGDAAAADAQVEPGGAPTPDPADPTKTARSPRTAVVEGRPTATMPSRRAPAAPVGAVMGPDGTPSAGTPTASELTKNVVSALREGHTNLTADPGNFIGRASDLAALAELAGRGERLVTITGPGGAGKTRLARRYGASRLPEIGRAGSGGVWFCDLTEARTAEGVCSSVAEVLGLALSTGGIDAVVSEIGHSLAGRGAALLILDNLEQVVHLAPATVGRWLQLAPQTQIVATSREVLGIPGETVYELAALSLPEGDGDVTRSEAVQLFVIRAKAARRDFAVSKAEEPVIAEIVRRLEGMPLAIELAAARVGVLPPVKLLERLSKGLDVLGGGGRDLSARHATLKKTIEWSWNLLQPWEQAALSQAAVFRGGFTIDAAEAIIDLSGIDEAPPVLDVVQSLRSKSLLRMWEPPALAGEFRFGMYSIISEFAREQLSKSGRAPEVQQRHGEWFLRWSSDTAAGIEGPQGPECLHRLALEVENLVAILQRGLSVKPPTGASVTLALEALRALDPVLGTRGPFESHLAWLDEALAAASSGVEVDGSLVATALEYRGWIRRLRGLSDDAVSDFRRARELAKAAGDRVAEARVLDRMGTTLVFQGHRAEGTILLEEAIERLAMLADRGGEARALLHLGDAYAATGRAEDARAAYVRGLAIVRERGDRRLEAMLLRGLGALVWSEGKLEEARECQERALPIATEYADRDLQGSVHGTLAGIAHEQGRFEEARSHYQRAMELHGEVGKRWAQARWLGNRGILEHEQGKYQEAALCYDGASEWCAATGHRREEGLYRAYLGAVRAATDDLRAADRAFASADKLLAGDDDSLPRVAVETLKGHLDVAHCRAAAKAGDLAQAEALQAAAMARVKAAQSRDADGGPSPAERSEDVRHALRLLRTSVQSAMGLTLKLRRAAKAANPGR